MLLPDAATDQHGEPFAVTGLSGVTWLGGLSYAAVMDNSDKVVLFDLALAADGSIESLSGVRGISLDRSGDLEGIARAGEGSVLIGDERNTTVGEYSLADGSLVRLLPVPAVYESRRNNRGLESLTFDPETVWVANEEALVPDGPRASPAGGTTVRLLRVQPRTGAALSQQVYFVEPMHGPRFPFGNPGQSGLTDLVALPDGTLLALERSLAFADPVFLTRIYELDFAGAGDVSHFEGLADAEFTAVGKRLLYQGGHANLEGLCLGPRLGPGMHALVGVVDDGDPVSTNTIVVFRLSGLEACPADTNDDGEIDIEDLHHQHTHPEDLNGDGSTDAEDSACLAAYLRRHEWARAMRREDD